MSQAFPSSGQISVVEADGLIPLLKSNEPSTKLKVKDMPTKPDPEDIPTLEEMQEELGPDVMSFFHDMVSPNDPKERGDEEE